VNQSHSQPGKPRPPTVAGPYFVALLFVAFAFLLRFLLSPVVRHPSPYLLCGLAVIAAASYGGWGPGLFATATGALVGWYLYVRPAFGNSDAVQLISFLLIAIVATFLSARLRSAKRSAEVVAARNKEIIARYRFNLEAANAVTFDWNILTGEVHWSENEESIHAQPAETVDGTLDDILRFVHPEDRDMVRRNIKVAIDGMGHCQVECRYIRRDGSVGWMEGQGRVIYQEQTRRPIRMMGVGIDATERKRNEQARLQLAAIVDSSDDAIISADLTGVILTWNAAAGRMYGYTASEAIGSDITLLFASSCASRKAEILERLTRGERVEPFEAQCVHKDGRPICVSLTISPIDNAGRAAPTASFIARDITQHKAFEEQLRQSAKLESLGILAGGIAHDFNNILVGILGNASLVRELLLPVSPARPMLDDVIRASERAASLTAQLLAYSGKGKFVIQPVDLSDLARDMLSLIKSSIPKTVRLQSDLAAGLPPVIADLTQMQQIIMNLVINGAEAIGERPGVVTVSTGVQYLDEHSSGVSTLSGDAIKPGRYVSLEVRDDGCGMDEATIEKIFDPFFTTKFTGRGLGLSATLGIVRGHQGQIQVESRPGEGCAFRVLIPAAEEPMPATRDPEAANVDLTGSGAVLVVDDEEVVRRAAAVTLEHCGYTAIMASEGQAAIALFRKFSSQIVLVVLDLSMPLMNGEECLRLMRGIQPDVPVILSSGFSQADIVARFQVRGFAGFLQKPYTAQRLAALAHAVIHDSGRKMSQISA